MAGKRQPNAVRGWPADLVAAMYQWIEVKSRASYQQLDQFLPVEDFALQAVINKMQLGLSDEVGALLLEFPYVDKDYRSAYYHYYAKKGSAYLPHCARVHLLRRGWRLEGKPWRLLDGDGKDAPGFLEEANGYLGFIVLRPTRQYTIGRSVLSPRAVQGATGKLIEARHKAHFLGYKAHVRGFPFMQQHGDISVCAHAALWAVLRHYSERYSLYREVLLHDISALGREFNPGGLLPSLGITAVDAERIFAEAGTFPLLVPRPKEQARWHEFYAQMLAYLDSGFPLFGVQTGQHHAVAVVGYRASQTMLVQPPTGDRAMLWNYVSHLVVVDDNHFPYLAVPRVKGSDGYDMDAFDGFIAPLPEKMFLPATQVSEVAKGLIDHPAEHFEDLEQQAGLGVRHFLTTTAAWHRHIRRTIHEYPAQFSDAALELAMPQFIWVAEYATPTQWAAGQIHARLVLDATAGQHEPFPAFLLHDANGALWVDRANRQPQRYQRFKTSAGPLSRMDSNLASY